VVVAVQDPLGEPGTLPGERGVYRFVIDERGDRRSGGRRAEGTGGDASGVELERRERDDSVRRTEDSSVALHGGNHRTVTQVRPLKGYIDPNSPKFLTNGRIMVKPSTGTPKPRGKRAGLIEIDIDPNFAATPGPTGANGPTGAAGLGLSKTDLYKRSATVTCVGDSQCSASALCDDVNDVAIGGFCDAQLDILRFFHIGIDGNDDPALQSSHTCAALNTERRTDSDMTSHVWCVNVP
jgi:hypothetical protein